MLDGGEGKRETVRDRPATVLTIKYCATYRAELPFLQGSHSLSLLPFSGYAVRPRPRLRLLWRQARPSRPISRMIQCDMCRHHIELTISPINVRWDGMGICLRVSVSFTYRM